MVSAPTSAPVSAIAPTVPAGASMDELLAALRAAAESTRLRLLVLCARGELTVSELAQILGQSQPRVSRHLKLLCDAGLLDRFREGSWVFYRVRSGTAASGLVRQLVSVCGDADRTIALDLQRLAAIKRQRAELAAAYFRENAAQWDKMRSAISSPRGGPPISSTSGPVRAACWRSSDRMSGRRSALTNRARCWRWPASTSNAPGSPTARCGSATCTSCPYPMPASTRP